MSFENLELYKISAQELIRILDRKKYTRGNYKNLIYLSDAEEEELRCYFLVEPYDYSGLFQISNR